MMIPIGISPKQHQLYHSQTRRNYAVSRGTHWCQIVKNTNLGLLPRLGLYTNIQLEIQTLIPHCPHYSH